MKRYELKDHIAGAVYGFAIGDSVGAITEFMSKDEIKSKYGEVTKQLGGGWLNLKPGEVTDDTQMMLCVMDALMKLPGVGRKTANVIQAVAFGRSVIAVDTHVFRVSHRLGLVSKGCDTPLKVERELMKNIPHELAADAHHWLLLHGRYVCTSRAPHCNKCPFDAFCPKMFDGSKLG